MPKRILLVFQLCTWLLRPAFGQDNDWDAVMRLKRGMMVTVSLLPSAGEKHGKPPKPEICKVLDVSSDSLECGIITRDREWMLTFRRQRINEIREILSAHGAHISHGMLIGGVIGGALFGITAAQLGAGVQSGWLSSAYGAAIGGVIGLKADSSGTKFKTGDVLYRAQNQPATKP